jgi:uncharacterized protein (DUF1684 family)
MGWIEEALRLRRPAGVVQGFSPAVTARAGLKACTAFIALAALLASACSSKPPDEPKDYVGRIAAERAAKDASFAAGDDPIPKPKHAQFLPLAYFAIDPAYNTPGVLKPIDDKTIYEMPTSTGANRKMRKVGSLEFTLKGQPMKLLAFNEVGTEPGSLFVAFSDLTSGTETYAAGRFMDLTRNATGIYEVDFNRAYIPYCYYNPTYECPYPPPENRLKIPVRAGERVRSTKSEVRSTGGGFLTSILVLRTSSFVLSCLFAQ